MRPFITTKTVHMYNYLNSTLRDINPDLFIVYVGKNNIPATITNNKVADDIIIKKPSGFDAISHSVLRRDNYKTKFKVIKSLKNMQKRRSFLIGNNNITSIRHFNTSKRHLNDVGSSVLIRNFKQSLTSFEWQINQSSQKTTIVLLLK